MVAILNNLKKDVSLTVLEKSINENYIVIFNGTELVLHSKKITNLIVEHDLSGDYQELFKVA